MTRIFYFSVQLSHGINRVSGSIHKFLCYPFVFLSEKLMSYRSVQSDTFDAVAKYKILYFVSH
jgi:hypothetical protein